VWWAGNLAITTLAESAAEVGPFALGWFCWQLVSLGVIPYQLRRADEALRAVADDTPGEAAVRAALRA